MTRKVVEALYNKLAVHAKKHTAIQKQFDEACREQYGCNYQECDFKVGDLPSLADSDSIIDTLDYGTDGLPFAEFDKLMMKAKAIREGL
jgi:hypothetical protein